MDKKKILKICGIVGIVAGSVALYLGGGSASMASEIVGGVFVLAGIIAGIIVGSE